ncbi:hypothetical protein L1887_17511 [Cichorium endivia]|nr:hypothetical protein L1887_17511 [Cichorium endivia]
MLKLNKIVKCASLPPSFSNPFLSLSPLLSLLVFSTPLALPAIFKGRPENSKLHPKVSYFNPNLYQVD